MTTTADFAPAGARPPRFRHIRSRPEIWLGLPWIMVFAAIVAWQFTLGIAYNSNSTTNLFLQLGRGAAYALLPVLVVAVGAGFGRGAACSNRRCRAPR